MIKILLVGEAWGEMEKKFSHALVGPSGVELARMLSEVGLAPKPHNKYPTEMDMIYHWGKLKSLGIETANVFNDRPENNEIERFFDIEGDKSLPPLKPGKYIRKDFMHHVYALWKLIEEKKPNLVLCMGNAACWAVLGKTGISEIRGSICLSDRLKVKALPIYHPAYILRVWGDRPATLADLMKAQRECEFPEIRRVERWITAHDHVRNIRITLEEIRDWLQTPAQSFAVDIESGYALYTRAEISHMTPQMRNIISSQISMVGFASSPNRALVIPLMDRNCPNLSYWPNENEEAQAWRVIVQALRTPIPKMFQNGMYDIGRFVAHGIMPKMCEDDTMLHHHALYPEQLKSLGFLGSIYSNEISWKQVYGKSHDSFKRDE